MKLILENVSKRFDEKSVIKNTTYEFEQNNIYTILGRNGAGKTTLFNCMCENLEFDSGSVFLETGKNKKKVKFEDIGMVSASPALPEFLTGYEFIRFYMQIKSDNIKDNYSIDDYFNLVRLDETDRHKLIKEYSFGMKNKIQLLTCIITRPKIILLDEPLSSFDIIVSHDIKELLINIKKEHVIIMSTHILQLAQDISDDIVLLKNGKLNKTEYQSSDKNEFEENIVQLLAD